MATFLPKNRKLRAPFILAALVIFLAVGYAGAKWVAWPYFKSWREKRANQVARDYFQKGDYPNALLAVRKSLGYNQQNTDSWRLAVDITEKQNSSEIVIYQQRLAALQPTLENKLKYIQLAVKYNAYPQAQEAVNAMGSLGANSPEFLELAAQVSRRMGNATKAKYYLMSLVKLRPDDTKARFDLAQIRLLEGFSENKPAIRAEIRSLSNDPAYRTRGLALLLADSLEAKNASEALELADQLATSVDIGPTNQVLVAEAYRRHATMRFSAYLKRLEESFASEPNKVVILTNYLMTNDMSEETRRWIDSLSDKVKAVEGVQVTYAYTLLLLKDWPALETYLRNCKWTENEYARHALLAYRYQVAGRDREYGEEWKLAVIDVGNNPRKLQTLLAQVTAWNWQNEKYELLWKRFMLDPHNESVRTELIRWERSKGNTTNLNRLFSRIIELDPKDMNSKNNYAYTSILLGINLDRAYQAAYEAYTADPKNAYYATTESLALYRQGKTQEALQTLLSVGAAALSVPERTLLQSVYLVANGKVDEGASLASRLGGENFLPEERRLLADASVIVQKNQREKGNAMNLAVLNAANAASGVDRKSWLNSLPASLRKASPSQVQMELADQLYASDDYKGLESSLRSDKWEQNDFLRLALLSYAQRNLNKDSEARSTWRIALASAGSRDINLEVLASMSERWNWTQERLEILNRIYQRDPTNSSVFNELLDNYSKNNQTSELARIYDLRKDANPSDSDAKSHFAYYSLLTGSNVSRAHVAAKEAYDAANDNVFAAKVYAFSLIKQSRAADAVRLLEKLPEQKETGTAQISLLRAALALQKSDAQQARASLSLFDASSALPEEAALATSITQTLSKKDA